MTPLRFSIPLALLFVLLLALTACERPPEPPKPVRTEEQQRTFERIFLGCVEGIGRSGEAGEASVIQCRVAAREAIGE